MSNSGNQNLQSAIIRTLIVVAAFGALGALAWIAAQTPLFLLAYGVALIVAWIAFGR